MTASPSNPPKSLKNPYLARPSSLAPAGRASAAAAGAAAGSALGNGAAVGVGEEDGNGPRSVVAVAVFAGDRRIGILDRAQDVEAGFAVQTNVFVERHNIILNLESNRVNGRLYSFGGYFNNVEDWKVGSVEVGRLQDANRKLAPSTRSGGLARPRSGDLGDQRALTAVRELYRAYRRFKLSRFGLCRIWEKPVDVTAIVTDQAIRRYVCPVEFEEGGKGSV